MHEYSFDKGLAIIIENIIKGLPLIFPLIFDNTARHLIYAGLFIFIGKGFYKLYYKNTIKVPIIILFCIPLSGVFTGFCIGFFGLAAYFNLLFKLGPLLFDLILACLIVLSSGIFLAYRIDIYTHKQQQLAKSKAANYQ